MSSGDSLILPAESRLVVPQSMQMTDRQSIGPVTVGDQFPWRGLVFRVSRIFGNDHNDFLMVLAPAGVTGGFVKRINGKKGKKNAKKAKKAARHKRHRRGVPIDSSIAI